MVNDLIKNLALTFFVLVITACTEPLAPLPFQPHEGGFNGIKEGAILGGYVDDVDTAVVGMVYIESGFIASSCTGSLIAPNVVLTAQHCIANISTDYGVQCGVSEYLTPFGAPALGVTTDTTITGYTQFYGVSQVHVPDFSVDPPGGNPKEACNNDIAILVLTDSISSAIATPLVPRVDTPLGDFEQYSAIGYGIDNLNGSGGFIRRRKDNLFTQCVGINCDNEGIPSVIWVGDPSSICIGDSGGPGLDLDNRVAGVASAVTGGNCDYPLYSHVYDWGDWIRDVTKVATENAGIPVPAWALGNPTDPGYSFEVGGDCETAEECPSGLCSEGICSILCTESEGCPTGFICDGEQAVCTPAPLGESCSEESDAPVSSPSCASGLCLKGHCTRHCDALIPFCPSGYQCKQGVCALVPVGGPCGNDWDCPEASVCQDELYCTRYCDEFAPCPPEAECSAEDVCIQAIADPNPCLLNEDCEEGWCNAGVCAPPCATDSECPEGQECMMDMGVCSALVGEEETEDTMAEETGEDSDTTEEEEDVAEPEPEEGWGWPEGEPTDMDEGSGDNSGDSTETDWEDTTEEEEDVAEPEPEEGWEWPEGEPTDVQEYVEQEEEDESARSAGDGNNSLKDTQAPGIELSNMESASNREDSGCQSTGSGSSPFIWMGLFLLLTRRIRQLI